MPEAKPNLRAYLRTDAGTSSNPLPVESDDEMLEEDSLLSEDDTYGETPAVATTGRITNTVPRVQDKGDLDVSSTRYDRTCYRCASKLSLSGAFNISYERSRLGGS